MGVLRRRPTQRQVLTPTHPAEAPPRQVKLAVAKPIGLATTPDWAAA